MIYKDIPFEKVSASKMVEICFAEIIKLQDEIKKLKQTRTVVMHFEKE